LPFFFLTSAQIRAARSLIRWTAEDLAAASALSVATIRRAELKENQTALTSANDLAIRRALESAGVEFIDENGGGPGVRLRKRQQKKGAQGVIANAGFRYDGYRRSNGSVEQT
jgi:transcriptional regulator with XRE-family HTH domain